MKQKCGKKAKAPANNTKTTKKKTTTIRKVASPHVQVASQPHESRKLNLVAPEKSGDFSYAIKKATQKEVLEYYDLPYRYNETIVKILAQTPKKLFIYWDISDLDRKNYINKFGENFFNNTVPVLLVHNNTLDYSFEVEINDFANCWYLDVTDSKCEYSIELGRRPKVQNYYIPNNYIYVASSDVIENPNDHILFEKQSNTVYFRNVKTNTSYSKDIANISFIRNMGKIYNIYDAYQKLYDTMYNDEDILNNPTSIFKQ